VADPARYYRNNLGDSLILLEALLAEGRRRGGQPLPLVFSSTCATYGIPDPEQIPIAETCPQRPINPYGRSKWMVEQLIADFGAAYGLPSVIFRYFNAAGADPVGGLGEDHTPETHLIPLGSPYLQIFGDDYPTADGTCIRDYIHVSDLADAHVLGLRKLLTEGGSHVFNLGNGTGYSVQQVIDTAKAVTGRGLLAHVAPPRRCTTSSIRSKPPKPASSAPTTCSAWRGAWGRGCCWPAPLRCMAIRRCIPSTRAAGAA
jgi:UDP-glucose 4-epimerase